MAIDEKTEITERENVKSNAVASSLESSGISSPAEYDDLADPDVGKSDEERAQLDKALVRKIDLWLVPWLSLLYLLSFLDRTNIGNARVAVPVGMEKSIHMVGRDYNNALTIFFIAYAGAEPLTNILLKRYSPRYFFTGIILLWGAIMTVMGCVNNQAGLLACRWFLGLAEAGLFPGVNYYLSCWYKRQELGFRAALFFSAAALAGSFGGLLAAAISNMHGVGGYEGWRWIFILEGLMTVFVGVFCYWMVFDFPDTATFLTPDERLRAQRRLRADNQTRAEEEKISRKYVFQAVKDWKTWLFALQYIGVLCALYSFSLFLPTIMVGMGYKGNKAQLMSVPPYAVAAAMTVFIGWVGDRTKMRGYCNMAVSLLGCTGFAMLLGSKNVHVQYAGTFLGAAGIYPAVPNTLSWVSNNMEGSLKRGVVIGIVVGCGNMNGVVSSNIYNKRDSPRYLTGHAIVFSYMFVCLFGGTVITHFMLKRENKLRKSGARDNWIEGKTTQEIFDLGDQRPDFIYAT